MMPVAPDGLYQPVSRPTRAPICKVISTFQAGHSFVKSSATGTQTDDTTTTVRGSQSLKLVTNGAAGACFSARTSINPTIDLTGQHVKVWIKTDKPANIAELYFYFSSDNLVANWVTIRPSDYSAVMKAGVWTPLTFALSGRNSTVTGSPNLAAINSVQVRVKDDATTSVALNVSEISFFPQPAAGAVSITFDDGRISQWTYAKPAMDKHGFPGVMYVYPTVIGDGTHVSLDQLKVMRDLGWDVASHSYSHPYLATLTDDELKQEFYRSKQWLLDNGFARGADELALPYGNYNTTSVLPIARRFFRSVRTIDHQNETIVPADPYKLRSFYVVNTTTLASAKAAVDLAVSRREWVIFVFHTITTGAATDPVEWTQTNFIDLMDYIAAQGVAVRTVSDVLND